MIKQIWPIRQGNDRNNDVNYSSLFSLLHWKNWEWPKEGVHYNYCQITCKKPQKKLNLLPTVLTLKRESSIRTVCTSQACKVDQILADGWAKSTGRKGAELAITPSTAQRTSGQLLPYIATGGVGQASMEGGNGGLRGIKSLFKVLDISLTRSSRQEYVKNLGDESSGLSQHVAVLNWCFQQHIQSIRDIFPMSLGNGRPGRPLSYILLLSGRDQIRGTPLARDNPTTPPRYEKNCGIPYSGVLQSLNSSGLRVHLELLGRRHWNWIR